MAEKINEGQELSPSEEQEKREWDELIDWCMRHEEDTPMAEAFLSSIRVATFLQDNGFPERVIESAWKITYRLEDKARALRGKD